MEGQNLLWVDFLIFSLPFAYHSIFNWTLKGSLKNWSFNAPVKLYTAQIIHLYLELVS